MKTKDLIPPELMHMVMNSVLGTHTEESRKLIKEKCGLDIEEIFTGDDPYSFELCVRYADNEEEQFESLLVEAGDTWTADTYMEVAYLSLLSEAIGQLPSWVWDADEFKLNLEEGFSFQDYTTDEYESAFNVAWDLLFNNHSPMAWRARKAESLAKRISLTPYEVCEALYGPSSSWQPARVNEVWGTRQDMRHATLVAKILHSMLDKEGESVPLWVLTGKNMPVSFRTLGMLEKAYQGFEDELMNIDREADFEEKEQAEEGAEVSEAELNTDNNSYVSPFTGQIV